MPVPVVPRRAGPPRKKPVKPTAAVPDVPEEQPPIAEESHQPLEESASGEQIVSLSQVPEHEALKEETASDPDTRDATPAPIVHTMPVSSDAEKEEAGSKEVYTPDTTEKFPGTESPSAEEASGIASPSPSFAISEHKKSDDTADDVDVEQMEELNITADVPPVGHHHPTPLTEPSAIQQVDEKLLAEPVAAVDIDDKEDEAEEEARRKRIAERLANMGGINPLAPPPQTESSSDETHPAIPTVIHDEYTTSTKTQSDIPLAPATQLEPVGQINLTVELEADGKY